MKSQTKGKPFDYDYCTVEGMCSYIYELVIQPKMTDKNGLGRNVFTFQVQYFSISMLEILWMNWLI